MPGNDTRTPLGIDPRASPAISVAYRMVRNSCTVTGARGPPCNPPRPSPPLCGAAGLYVPSGPGAVESVHRLHGAVFHDAGDRVRAQAHDFLHHEHVLVRELGQHVAGEVLRQVALANPQPEAHELVGAQHVDERAEPVLAPVRPPLAHAQRTQLEGDVVHDGHEVGGGAAHRLEQAGHRDAAAVHEGERLGEADFLAADRRLRDERVGFFPPARHPSAGGERVHHHEAGVVAGPAVALPRVPQTHHQAHGAPDACVVGYFFSFFSAFFSGFSAALGSSATSPSTGALPFLMTSGSATSPSAAGAASATGATSSARGATTCAITMSDSVRMVTLSGALMSATRTCLPISRLLMSTVIFSGMSAGRHSTSSSRVTQSTMPPCTFTPTGVPTSSTCTLTCSAL